MSTKGTQETSIGAKREQPGAGAHQLTRCPLLADHVSHVRHVDSNDWIVDYIATHQGGNPHAW
jgi:hypothetical protein